MSGMHGRQLSQVRQPPAIHGAQLIRRLQADGGLPAVPGEGSRERSAVVETHGD